MKPNGILIQNAKDVVSFLRSSMSLGHAAYENAQLHVDRNFIKIKVGEVNRTHRYNRQIVVNSRSLQSMRSISHASYMLLETKELSCFCDKCIDDLAKGDCSSKSHVAPWTLVTLQPYSSFDAHCDIDTDGASWGNDGKSDVLA